MSLLLARNLRKFLEKSSAIQLSVKNQGRSDINYKISPSNLVLFMYSRKLLQTIYRLI